MPELPQLTDLPPEALARLRALNPELTDELTAPRPPERADPMVALEARMQIAKDAALSALYAASMMQVPPLPEPPAKDRSGSLVFRYAGATIAAIYLFSKAGAFG